MSFDQGRYFTGNFTNVQNRFWWTFWRLPFRFSMSGCDLEAACHDPFCRFGIICPDSCTVFWQSTSAEASLHLTNDLTQTQSKLEMMLPRFSSTGSRIQFYTVAQYFIHSAFSFSSSDEWTIHFRKRNVAETIRGITYNTERSTAFFRYAFSFSTNMQEKK